MTIYEENPFEEKAFAQEWINTIENEKGTIRDKEINPGLAKWIEEFEPKTVLDIGCGQGICSTKLGVASLKYIGIDPSAALIARAKELYGSPDRSFMVGNAYALPVENESIDACFSVTVWFHLEHPEKAGQELHRVLSSGGKFLIITADPDAYKEWETHYSDVQVEGKKMVGDAKVLLNPDESVENHRYAHMSRNTFYLHSIEEIKSSFTDIGLVIDKIEKIGSLPIHKDKTIFIKIFGHKK